MPHPVQIVKPYVANYDLSIWASQFDWLLIFFVFLQSVFAVMLGPFAFFNAQKTKYLQIITSFMRWIGKNSPSLLHIFQFPDMLKVLVSTTYFSTYTHFHFLDSPLTPLCLCGCRAQVRPSWFGPALCLWSPSPLIPQPDRLDRPSQAWLDCHSQGVGRK